MDGCNRAEQPFRHPSSMMLDPPSCSRMPVIAQAHHTPGQATSGRTTRSAIGRVPTALARWTAIRTAQGRIRPVLRRTTAHLHPAGSIAPVPRDVTSWSRSGGIRPVGTGTRCNTASAAARRAAWRASMAASRSALKCPESGWSAASSTLDLAPFNRGAFSRSRDSSPLVVVVARKACVSAGKFASTASVSASPAMIRRCNDRRSDRFT